MSLHHFTTAVNAHKEQELTKAAALLDYLEIGARYMNATDAVQAYQEKVPEIITNAIESITAHIMASAEFADNVMKDNMHSLDDLPHSTT